MTTIGKFFAADWAYAIGWTLMHSLWQSLVIAAILKTFLRFVPAAHSRIRYGGAVGALSLFITSVLATFIYMLDGYTSTLARHGETVAFTPALNQYAQNSSVITDALSSVPTLLDKNIPLILTVWLAGFVFSIARLIGGIYTTAKLRSTARILENEWRDYITLASRGLGIRRVVQLAESGAISSPVVIGYLKPLIIIPVGMLTGLTTEQLETIFMHELAHIKRHDYLVNLIQSMIETVFFFNPSVRIISNVIRREREYCCDDLVIARHGGARAYAHALTRLEEVRLLAPAFALPLAENKNQLLDRIRRIMEKSSNSYSGKHRILIPVAALAAGLFCVSWLGINADSRLQSDPAVAAQDTVKKKAPKGTAKYSRKSIVTIDENGQPHEEVVEEFEGDEALRPLIQKQFPDVPGLPDVPGFPPPARLPALLDTIPPAGFSFRQEKWEEFSEAFDEAFSKAFEEFNSLRDTEAFGKLEELQERLEARDWEQEFEVLENFPDSTVFKDLETRLENLQELQLPAIEQHIEQLRELDIKSLRDLEDILSHREGNLRRFEQAIKDQLIADGYLSSDEPIESLQWSNDSFKVNGKEVKDSDMEKYRALHDKYLRNGRAGKLE